MILRTDALGTGLLLGSRRGSELSSPADIQSCMQGRIPHMKLIIRTRDFMKMHIAYAICIPVYCSACSTCIEIGKYAPGYAEYALGYGKYAFENAEYARVYTEYLALLIRLKPGAAIFLRRLSKKGSKLSPPPISNHVCYVSSSV